MREKIRQWYNNGQQYAQGAAIYAEHGTDPGLCRLIVAGRTPFTEKRLKEELLRLYEGTSAGRPAQQHAVKPASSRQPADGQQVVPQTPEQQQLHDEKRMLFKQQDALRHRLEDYPDDIQRGQAAHQILALQDQIDDIMEKEQYYARHGHLPEPRAGVTDPGLLKYRLVQVGGYIRRYRNLIKQEPGNENYHRKLAEYEAERADVQRQIDDYQKRTTNGG